MLMPEGQDALATALRGHPLETSQNEGIVSGDQHAAPGPLVGGRDITLLGTPGGVLDSPKVAGRLPGAWPPEAFGGMGQDFSSTNHGPAFTAGGNAPEQATGSSREEPAHAPLAHMEPAGQAIREVDEGAADGRSAIELVRSQWAPGPNGSEIGGQVGQPQHRTTSTELASGHSQLQRDGIVGSEAAGASAQEENLAGGRDVGGGEPRADPDTTAVAQTLCTEPREPATKQAIPRLPIAARAPLASSASPAIKPVIPRLPVAAADRSKPIASSGPAVEPPDDDVVFVGEINLQCPGHAVGPLGEPWRPEPGFVMFGEHPGHWSRASGVAARASNDPARQAMTARPLHHLHRSGAQPASLAGSAGPALAGGSMRERQQVSGEAAQQYAVAAQQHAVAAQQHARTGAVPGDPKNWSHLSGPPQVPAPGPGDVASQAGVSGTSVQGGYFWRSNVSPFYQAQQGQQMGSGVPAAMLDRSRSSAGPSPPLGQPTLDRSRSSAGAPPPYGQPMLDRSRSSAGPSPPLGQAMLDRSRSSAGAPPPFGQPMPDRSRSSAGPSPPFGQPMLDRSRSSAGAPLSVGQPMLDCSRSSAGAPLSVRRLMVERSRSLDGMDAASSMAHSPSLGPAAAGYCSEGAQSPTRPLGSPQLMVDRAMGPRLMSVPAPRGSSAVVRVSPPRLDVADTAQRDGAGTPRGSGSCSASPVIGARADAGFGHPSRGSVASPQGLAHPRRVLSPQVRIAPPTASFLMQMTYVWDCASGARL